MVMMGTQTQSGNLRSAIYAIRRCLARAIIFYHIYVARSHAGKLVIELDIIDGGSGPSPSMGVLGDVDMGEDVHHVQMEGGARVLPC